MEEKIFQLLLKMDGKILEMDNRMTGMDQRMVEMDQKMVAMDQRMVAMDQKMTEMNEEISDIKDDISVMKWNIDEIDQDLSQTRRDLKGEIMITRRWLNIRIDTLGESLEKVSNELKQDITAFNKKWEEKMMKMNQRIESLEKAI